MALFNDEIDYNTYETSVIKDNEQIDTDIVIADKKNFDYTLESDTPLNTIINSLPGFKNNVTYFNKIAGNQDVYEYPDLSLDDLVVEYTKIENMTIYMDDGIDSNNLNDYEGTGYIHSGIEPKPGDAILTQLYDKRTGLFVVSNTEPVTYNFNRIYRITFKFYMFPTQDDLNKLYRSVNKELVADETLNNNGNEILYDKDRYTGIKKIVSLIPKYMNIWIHNIIKADNNYTVSYYDKEENTYIGDGNVEKFIINLFGITNIREITLFNKPEINNTILDLLIDKDNDKWGMAIHYTSRFIYDTFKNPFLKSFMYNQIDYFIETSSDVEDDYYIFSKEFYDGLLTTEDSVTLSTYLESNVFNMIFNNDIDLESFNGMLDEIDKSIKDKNYKEIFYHIPIAIAVMKYFKYKHNYPDKFLY